MKRGLASYFSLHGQSSSNSRWKFYDKYKMEVDGYDKDFIKKHDEDLNTTLIFVSEEFLRHVE